MHCPEPENTALSAVPSPGWRLGTVSWFDGPKGFGFIQPVGGRELPVFVDHTCIDTPGYRVLIEGQRVLFRGRSRAEVVKPATAEAVSVERELAR